MAFVEAMPSFFVDFGVTATLNGVAVTGIFDNAHGEAFGGLVAGSGPTFTLPSSDGHARGQALVIGGATYTVSAVEPDGTGLSLLRLEKQ